MSSANELISNMLALGMSTEEVTAMIAKLAAAKSSSVIADGSRRGIDINRVTDGYILENFINKKDLESAINGLVKVTNPLEDYEKFSGTIRDFYTRLLAEIRHNGLHVFGTKALVDIYSEGMAHELVGTPLTENAIKFLAIHHSDSFRVLVRLTRYTRPRIENAVKVYVAQQGHVPCELDEHGQLSETETITDTRAYPHLHQWLKSRDLC